MKHYIITLQRDNQTMRQILADMGKPLTPTGIKHPANKGRRTVNDQLTLIVAALLSGTNYSSVSKTVITGVVDQAEAIVAEINSRFKGGPSAS